jgi:Tfp pilus assembly protein PilX
MSAIRKRVAHEGGHTVSELMVVVVLLGIVGVAILQSLVSATRVTSSGQDRSVAVAEARTTLERFERDIRAANPIEAAANVEDYETTVSFGVYCSDAGVGTCDATNQRRISWHYDKDTKQLSRSEGSNTAVVIGPSSSPSLPADQQHLAVVNPDSTPMFQYYDRTATRMPTDSTFGGSTNDFRNCAKEVVVTLVVRAESRTSSVIDLQTSATLRNHNEVIGC